MTLDEALRTLEIRPIADIGQLGPALRRQLDRRVKSGELIKYRGYWNTLSPHWGIGPLKTIYARDPDAIAGDES